MTRQYEMMFILELGEEQETLQQLKTLLTQDGKILKENNMGIRTLAYPIQKREKGYYHVFEMEMPASKIRSLEEDIRLNEKILRWMKLSLDYRKKKRSKRKTPRIKKTSPESNAESTVTETVTETVKTPIIETATPEERTEEQNDKETETKLATEQKSSEET